MKHCHLFKAGILLLALCACSREISVDESGGEVSAIRVIGPADIVFEEPATRGTEIINGSTLRFSWAQGDSLGIFPDRGNQVEFPITSTEGGNSAVFDGGGWGLKNGSSYAAYYPFSVWNYHRNSKTILLDYTGQVQEGNGSFAHLSAYDYLASSRITPSGGSVTFEMNRLGAILYIDIVVPEPTTINSLVISCDEEVFVERAALDVSGEVAVATPAKLSKTLTLEFENTVTTEANETVRGYMAAFPVDFSGKSVYATLNTEAGQFGASVVSKEVKQGKATFLRFSEDFYNPTEFNEDAYITYVANHESWFLGGNQYINDTYFTGATGTRFEMKFQIPSYTSMSEVTLASESGNRYNDVFKVTRNRLFYRTETKDDQEDTDLTSGYIDGTSLVVFSASCDGSQVTATVNGVEKTVSLPLSSFDLGYLFSSYYHDNDEGSETAFKAGVPDGAKLYYTKIWNGDELVYFGHAARANCPYSSNIEYCWYEELSQTCTFARELSIPSGADPGYGNTSNATIRQPFGGGVDVAVPVSGITLNKTSIAFTAAGETDQLTATAAPSNATISTVTWSSSDNTVATVRPDGTVIAVGDGTATITATANDGSGVTAECKITMGNIVFADKYVKSICVAHWDTNGDGELSYTEAATVKGTGSAFAKNSLITTFDEFKYFTSVTSASFSGCGSLTQLSIPESLVNIDFNFAFCYSLTRVDIPNLETWCKISFSSTGYPFISSSEGHLYLDGAELTEINVPTGITEINSYAFAGCNNISSILIHEGVTSIGAGAFRSCSGLASISIPSSVTSIGAGAFYGCSSLPSINIPSSVTSISGNAFYNCSNLTRIDITDLESWCNISFGSYLYTRGHSLYLNGVELFDVTVPNTITEIKASTFEYCSNLTSVSIPSDVTSIGAGAFYGCSDLISINIPESATYIGSRAFEGCSNLTSSISIPEGVTSLEDRIFSGCSSLTSISIPYVTSIGEQAFYNCGSLKSINMPSVTSIEKKAFSGCTSLERLDISLDNWCVIDFNTTDSTHPFCASSTEHHLFQNGIELTEVDIPDNIERIKDYAFYRCNNLTKVFIPSSVISVGNSAFGSCSSLNRVDITSLESWCNIDFSANQSNPLIFAKHLYVNGSEITEVSIPESVTEIKPYVFCEFSNMSSVIIPSGVTSIGNSAFHGCSGLSSITLPTSVTSIGENSFAGCTGLTSFVIPENVTTIKGSGLTAFLYGSGVEYVISLPPTPPTIEGSQAFYGVKGSIYVPDDSVSDYQTATNWTEYSSRIIPLSSFPE